MDILFNDEQITNGGSIKVQSFSESVLPERINYTIEVPGKHGSYYAGYKYAEKEFEVVLTVHDPQGVDDIIRELAWKLDVAEPSPLIISTKPGLIWYAVVDSISEVSRTNLNDTAEIEMTFKMFTPYGFSDTPKTITMASKKFEFNNVGTATALPKFEFDFNNDCSYISLVSSKGNVLIGSRDKLDKTALPASQQVYIGATTSLSGWTENDGVIPIANGFFGGTVGTSAGLTALSYGDYADVWHDPTIKRELTSAAQNFDIKAEVKFAASSTNLTDQKGRFDLVLLDEANSIIGRISLIDSSSGYAYAVPEFWFGSKRVWSETASTPKSKTVRQYNKTKKKWDIKTVRDTDMGDWNGFSGVMSVRYLDNRLTFEIEKYGGKKKVYTVQNANRLMGNRKLKAVSIWYGQYDNEPPMNENTLTKLNIKKHNVQRFVDIPNVFQEGDELEVDMEFQAVRLNGKLFLDAVDIGSNFFDIEEGETEVRVFTSKGASLTGKATFTERFI